MSSGPPDIRALSVEAYRGAIPGLAALTVDAVNDGSGVNFLAGVTEAETGAWWTGRVDAVAAGVITPFVAFDDDRIVGSVLLIRSVNATDPDDNAWAHL
ncbi:MAG: hypothetical protein ACTS8Z_00155, partial [Candidatus Limnocylindrales bacterium]